MLRTLKRDMVGRWSTDFPPYALPSCADLAHGWSIERFDSHQMWHADRLRAAKVCIFDGSIFRYPLSRYVECMSAGCLVLATMPWDGDELGFRDEDNMVAITPSNWLEKLEYYLGDDEARMAIVRRAHKFVRETHTCEARAELIIEQLEELL
jgi:hypothetical protein